MPRFLLTGCVAAAAAAAALACGAGATGVSTRGDLLIPACAWPASADTFDPATGVGCEPRTMFQICEVPSGSVLHADGTITTPEGTTKTCEDACTPTEYALTCRAPPDSTAPIAPPDALGCRYVTIPTPPRTSVLCCPCGG